MCALARRILILDLSDELGGAERVSRSMAEALTSGGVVRRAQLRRLRDDLVGPTRLWRAVSSMWRVYSLVARGRYCLTILNNQAAFLAYAPICRFAGAQVVYYEHSFQRRWFVRLWLATWVRLFARRVICVSEFMASRHGALSRGRVVVVHNGFDWPATTGGGEVVDRGRVTVACTAVMRPWKGQDLLLQALGKMPQTTHPVDVHLFGVAAQDHSEEPRPLRGRGYEQRVIELSRRLPPWIQVYTHPRLPDLWQYLRECDLVLVPSTSPDPLPTTVIEGLAAARVVVAARIGGIPEMVNHGTNGILFEAGDVTDLASTLWRLIEAPCTERERLGRAAQEVYLNRFSGASYRKRIREALADIC